MPLQKSKSFDKNSRIADSEYLYRAVRSKELLWKKRYSRPSSAIYTDPRGRGVSVERNGDREENKVIEFCRNQFEGYLVKINAGTCRDVGAYPIPKPTIRSDYHSVIQDSKYQIPISDDKREELAKLTQVVTKL